MKINLIVLAFCASFSSLVFGATSGEIRECPAFWRNDASVYQGRVIWLTENMTLTNAQSLEDEPCWASSNGESGKIKLIFAIPLDELKGVNPTENITFQIEMRGSTDDPSYTCDAQLGCAHVNADMLVFKELENATINNLPTDPLQVTFQKSNIRLMTHVAKTQEDLLKQRHIYLISIELKDLYWSQENPSEGFPEIYKKATARIAEKYGTEAYNEFLNFIETYESPNLWSFDSKNTHICSSHLSGPGKINTFVSVLNSNIHDYFDLFEDKMNQFIEDFELLKFNGSAIYLDTFEESQNLIKTLKVKIKSPVFSISQAQKQKTNAIYFESNLNLKHFRFQKVIYSIKQEGE